jgi:hypothetical protein
MTLAELFVEYYKQKACVMFVEMIYLTYRKTTSEIAKRMDDYK